MTQARDWLPASLAACSPVSAAVEAAVRDWSARWFARRLVRAETLPVAPGRPEGDRAGVPWRVYGGAVALRASKHALSRLSGAALDVDLDHVILTENDRAVVRAFEQALLAALCVDIESALGVQGDAQGADGREVRDPYGGAGGAEVVLADGIGSVGVFIALPLKLVLPLCRSILPPRRPRQEALSPLLASLASTKVIVEASLGEVIVSMSELRELSAGDILTLPTRLTAPAELRIKGSAQILGRGRLVEAAGDRALQLVSHRT